MKYYLKRAVIAPFVFALVSGCAGSKAKEEAKLRDPIAESSEIQARLTKAQEANIDMLSPEHYRLAQKYLKAGRKALSRPADDLKALRKLDAAEFHLDEAYEIATISRPILSEVLVERNRALEVRAFEKFPKRYYALEDELRWVTKRVERDSTSMAERRRGHLKKGYGDLELASIEQIHLGPARENLRKARSEGARRLTPKTLGWAEKQVKNSEREIVENRHDNAIVLKAGADADEATERLLALLGSAKVSEDMTPEELAMQLEADQREAEKLEDQLKEKTSEVATKESDIAALAAEKDKLVSQEEEDLKVEQARRQFTDEEAEVYRQGDKILVRLKGLHFPLNEAVVQPGKYSLLAKVQDMIKEVEPKSIIIEGHTDSTGPAKVNHKLSQARANAIEEYLVSNRLIGKDKVSSEGLADSRPIASNKTAAGRARNRRVDIIMTVPEVADMTAEQPPKVEKANPEKRKGVVLPQTE